MQLGVLAAAFAVLLLLAALAVGRRVDALGAGRLRVAGGLLLSAGCGGALLAEALVVLPLAAVALGSPRSRDAGPSAARWCWVWPASRCWRCWTWPARSR
jgi:hypothetical protein